MELVDALKRSLDFEKAGKDIDESGIKKTKVLYKRLGDLIFQIEHQY
jgi:hypothetical protein